MLSPHGTDDVAFLQKPHAEVPASSKTIFGDRPFDKVIKVRRGHKDGA